MGKLSLLLLASLALTISCGTRDDRPDNDNSNEVIVVDYEPCKDCNDPTLTCGAKDPCDPEPPPTPTPKSNCTIFMGNTQKQNPEKQKKLFEQIEKAQGCVVKDIFHTGDMSYGSAELETFLEDFSPVLAQKPQAKFWPARGNEDRMWPEAVDTLKSWFPYLTLSSCKSYYVKNGDLTIIVLDSEDHCSYDMQLVMVAQQLTGKPVAIVMHGAAFTSYEGVPDNHWARDDLHEIIKGWNVTVFNGEAKGYERNSVDGVKYVNPGSGGVCPDECSEDKDFTLKCKPTYSYVICTDMLQCSAVDSNGKTIDFF